MALLVDNNNFDTIGGNGLEISPGGSTTATIVLTDNFFSGANIIGGTTALLLENAEGSSSAVQSRLSGNRVLDSFADAYTLRQQDGSLALESDLATAEAEVTTSNEGSRVTVEGSLELIDPGATASQTPLLLGGFVWDDTDGDGVATITEPGRAFVLITLTEPGSGESIPSRSTLTNASETNASGTNASGTYFFSALLPGDYSVGVALPSGTQLTAQDQGDDDSIDSDFAVATATVGVTLSSLQDDLTIDAGLIASWQNPIDPLDVTGDGNVVPLDALVLINELNDKGTYRLSVSLAPPGSPPPFLDPTGDGFVSPIDVLHVINFLNEVVAQSEGPAPLSALREAEGSLRQPINVWLGGARFERRDLVASRASRAALRMNIDPGEPEPATLPRPAVKPVKSLLLGRTERAALSAEDWPALESTAVDAVFAGPVF
jgi:hypothetical protein